MLRKSPKCQGPGAMEIRIGNNMVSRRKHLYCTIFQQQFINSPQPRQFLRTKYFKKKLAMENAD